MEDNKPDFESMLKKNAFKIHPLDTEKAAVSIDHADWCLEHVWNTHVVPLQEDSELRLKIKEEVCEKLRADNKALKEEQERCLKALEQLANYNKNLLEEIERLKAELKNANSALDNISDMGHA